MIEEYIDLLNKNFKTEIKAIYGSYPIRDYDDIDLLYHAIIRQSSICPMHPCEIDSTEALYGCDQSDMLMLGVIFSYLMMIYPDKHFDIYEKFLIMLKEKGEKKS